MTHYPPNDVFQGRLREGTIQKAHDKKRNPDQSPKQTGARGKKKKKRPSGLSFLRRKVTKSKGLRATEIDQLVG